MLAPAGVVEEYDEKQEDVTHQSKRNIWKLLSNTAIETTEIFRDDITLAMDDLQYFNPITESSSETYENYSQLV